MSLSRRDFLGSTALGAVTAGALSADSGKTPLPTRVLGKTGVRVSILAFGGGSRYLSYQDDEQAIDVLKKALDLGITYIDSSDDYGRDHLSERRIGQAIRGRRDGVFLATKLSSRNPEAVKRAIEGSLKALQVDQVDLLHIHSLTDTADLAAIEAKGGVLDLLQGFREQKVTRFIGITSHTNPEVLKTAIERHDFDCTQMALNAGMVAMMNGPRGMTPNEAMKPSFETTALPVAVRKKMGILAMKIFAQDALVGQAPREKLLYYTLSLPVTAAVVGMPKPAHLEDNIRLAKAFHPLSSSEMKELSGKLSPKNKVALEEMLRSHVDA